jgi:hypothetical protein
MRTIISAKVLIMGTLLVIPAFSIASDAQTDKLQQINTEVNMKNNNLYEKNTDVNIQSRIEHIDDRCLEARKKVRSKEDEIDFSVRTRNEDLEKKAKFELQILRDQEAQYCN